jgi:uncharacterized protein
MRRARKKTKALRELLPAEPFFCANLRHFRTFSMDISREEQRVLHLLAQGGWMIRTRMHGKDTDRIECFTRDGWLAPDVGLVIFRKLKQKRAIASRGGKPYRITERGLQLVRSQLDNR